MTGSAWIASYVMLWILVGVLSVAVIALLRQIGVLHARLRPLGAHFAGEGPERFSVAPALPDLDYADAALTLVAFTSPGCSICAELRPGLRALANQYRDVAVHELANGPETAVDFASFQVRSTPYFVAVDRDGVVQGRGVANALEQIEELVRESLEAVRA